MTTRNVVNSSGSQTFWSQHSILVKLKCFLMWMKFVDIYHIQIKSEKILKHLLIHIIITYLLILFLNEKFSEKSGIVLYFRQVP